MKQTSQRFVSMILALVFLVAAFIVFFDLIQPAYGDLQMKKGEQVNDQTLLNTERDVVDRAKKLLTQYETVNQTQGDLTLAMPSGPSVASALGQLYGIAQNNGFVVTDIEIAAPTVMPSQSQIEDQTGNASTSLSAIQIIKPLGMLSFNVKASGSYETLKSFLAQLETNIRIFDVTGLSVQSVPIVSGVKGATQDFFTYDLTVVTYYQII